MLKKRQEYTFNINDIVKNIPVGISLPFNSDKIFSLNYTTRDQIKSNLINLILTNKNERPFNPDFGGNLRFVLFEMDSSSDELKDRITDIITNNISQISNIDVKILKDSDINTLYISISYSINNTDDTLNIQINK